MSAAAPTAGQDPKPGKKKLVIIIIAVVVLLAAAGGAAAFLFKKKSADTTEETDGGEVADAKAPKRDAQHGTPPAFVALDAFIVNLADRDVERFAQIGITLQVADSHIAEELKVYMPAIRNAVIMILSHKSSVELLTQDGKEKLANEIRREAARSMGYEVEEAVPEAPASDSSDAVDEAPKPKKKKKKRKAELYNPIAHVHYSSFIIQ